MVLALGNMIPLSSSPEILKEALFKYNKVFIMVDKLENDYTRTCQLEEQIAVEPSSPIISAARRYIVGINERLLYCKVKQKCNKSVIFILGIGEVKISDIKIWCNAKKAKQVTR